MYRKLGCPNVGMITKAKMQDKEKDMKKNKKTASQDAYYNNEENRVYAFHNVMFNFILYINAKDANDAMEKFDQCCMAHRDHWKVMVELKEQPTGA